MKMVNLILHLRVINFCIILIVCHLASQNGVPCFQRTIDQFIEKEELSDTFAFITYISSELVKNSIIKTLGFVIENGEISPDPDRLKPLKELPTAS